MQTSAEARTLTAGVVALAEARGAPKEYGAKAATLAELAHLGHAVAPGFCVAASALDAFAPGSAVETARALSEDQGDELRAAWRVAERATQLAMESELPDAFAQALLRAYARLDPRDRAPRVAVRSSAIGEDTTAHSFAGQHHTSLDVRGGDALLRAVKRGWASLYDVSAILYRRRIATSVPPRMALLVQCMLDCDVAGVLFSVDPIDPSADRMRLEAVRGGGARLVDGHGADASWTLERRSGRTIEASGAGESGLLETHWLEALHKLAHRLERELAAALDIEWGLVGENLYVLQARPATAGPRGGRR